MYASQFINEKFSLRYSSIKSIIENKRNINIMMNQLYQILYKCV